MGAKAAAKIAPAIKTDRKFKATSFFVASGAKAHVAPKLFMYGLKPVPFTEWRSFQY
jgi:hypothetical protein